MPIPAMKSPRQSVCLHDEECYPARFASAWPKRSCGRLLAANAIAIMVQAEDVGAVDNDPADVMRTVTCPTETVDIAAIVRHAPADVAAMAAILCRGRDRHSQCSCPENTDEQSRDDWITAHHQPPDGTA